MIDARVELGTKVILIKGVTLLEDGIADGV